MGNKFTIGADVGLTVKNIGAVVKEITSKLNKAGGNIKIGIDPSSQSKLDKLNQQIGALKYQAKQSASPLASAGAAVGQFTTNAGAGVTPVNNLANSVGRLGKSVKSLSYFAIAGTLVFSFVNGMKAGVKEAVTFNDAMVDISTTTGRLTSFLSPMKDEIRGIGKEFGVSTSKLATSAVTLAQAGLSAKGTSIALRALAKTELSPSFGDMNNTLEASIALFGQFNVQADRLESKLGGINAVSKRFAVESDDIATAIRKAGGAFSAAGGSVEELEGFFTTIRSRTRESASTIATSIKSLSSRLQSPDRQQRLEQLTGVKLQENGQFVGITKAIHLLADALARLPDGSLQKAVAVQEISGTHHLSRISVLLGNTSEAADVTRVALRGVNSLTADSENAQQKLSVRLEKTRQNFGSLFDALTDSGGFKRLTDSTLTFADSLADLGKTLTPLLPTLTALFALRVGASLGLGGLAKQNPLAAAGLVGGTAFGVSALSVANSNGNQNTKLGAGTTGFVSGAGAGAAIGSMGGPWGAAIGGVVGGVAGVVTSLTALTTRLEQVRLTASLDAVGDSAQDLAQALAGSSGKITGNIEKLFLENTRKIESFQNESINVGKEREKRAIQQGANYSMVLQSVMNAEGGVPTDVPTRLNTKFQSQERLAEQKSEAQTLLQPLTEGAGNRQAVLKGIAGRSTRIGQAESDAIGMKAIKQEIEQRALEKIESEKETLSIQQRIKIGEEFRAEVLNEVRAMEKLSVARQNIVKSIVDFDTGFERTIGGLDNLKSSLSDIPLSTATGTRFGQQTSRFGASGFNRVAGENSVLAAGNQANSLLSQSLPGILQKIALGTETVDGQTESVGVDSLRDSVFRALSDGGIEFGSAAGLAIGKKLDELEADPSKIAGLKDSPKGLQDFLLGDLDNLRAKFSELASALDSQNNHLLSELATFAATTAKINGMMESVGERRLEAGRFAIARNGRADNSGILANVGQAHFAAEQQRITGLPGNLALDPASLLQQAIAGNAGAENARKQFEQTGNPQFALQMKTFEQASANAVRGLERLADSTSRVSDLQNRLAAIERDENSRLGATEKFIQANPLERQQIARDNQLLKRASVEGFGKFNEQDKIAALRGADFLGGDTALPGGQGLTVADLKKALLEQEAKKLGFANPAGAFEKQNVENQIANALQTSVNAQNALVQMEQQLQQNFFTNLANQHGQFLNALGIKFDAAPQIPMANANANPLKAFQPQPVAAAPQAVPQFPFQVGKPNMPVDKKAAFQAERERRREAFQQGKEQRRENFDNRGGNGNGNPIEQKELAQALMQFNEKADRIVQVIDRMPHQIEIQGNQKNELIVNGGEVFNQLAPQLSEMFEKQISDKISKAFKFVLSNCPDAHRV